MDFQEIKHKLFYITVCGHNVMVGITASTHPDSDLWNGESAAYLVDINRITSALCRNELNGEFESSIKIILSGEMEQTIIGYKAVWSIAYDYKQFLRLFRWWWNYDFSEALLQETFETTYGKRIGEHYYEKWCLFERSIPKMVGYFADDTQKGQQLFDMIIEKVIRYENRTQIH